MYIKINDDLQYNISEYTNSHFYNNELQILSSSLSVILMNDDITVEQINNNLQTTPLNTITIVINNDKYSYTGYLVNKVEQRGYLNGSKTIEIVFMKE